MFKKHKFFFKKVLLGQFKVSSSIFHVHVFTLDSWETAPPAFNIVEGVTNNQSLTLFLAGFSLDKISLAFQWIYPRLSTRVSSARAH